jgi:hypothetical protein
MLYFQNTDDTEIAGTLCKEITDYYSLQRTAVQPIATTEPSLTPSKALVGTSAQVGTATTANPFLQYPDVSISP